MVADLVDEALGAQCGDKVSDMMQPSLIWPQQQPASRWYRSCQKRRARDDLTGSKTPSGIVALSHCDSFARRCHLCVAVASLGHAMAQLSLRLVIPPSSLAQTELRAMWLQISCAVSPHISDLGEICAYAERWSIVVSALDQRPRGRGFASAGCGLSRSNRGPVALCTVGLGLLNPPPSRGR